jgi:hypothetical protein
MSRQRRAFDARTGKKLWETIVGGNVSVSTISYSPCLRADIMGHSGNGPLIRSLFSQECSPCD